MPSSILSSSRYPLAVDRMHRKLENSIPNFEIILIWKIDIFISNQVQTNYLEILTITELKKEQNLSNIST